MARRRIIEPNKICNSCRSKHSIVWHKDRKWGDRMIGWLCHNCYNAIVYREMRPFLTYNEKISRNRPKGLVYNKKK